MKNNPYYVNGIKSNDSEVIEAIYKQMSRQIFDFVLKNSGTEEDAKDVFQDGLLVVYKKIRKNELVLTAKFSTYLFSVCRYIWLKKIKTKKGVTSSFESELIDDTDIEAQLNDVEKRKIFEASFEKLPEECQEILKLHFEKVPGARIAEMMGYTIQYVKRKKYKCKNGLIKLVRLDKRFKDFRVDVNENI